MKDKKEWIGVDLDGTLAQYDKWRGVEHIGEPIKPMLEKVKKLLFVGKRVKIFTARVCEVGSKEHIEKWLEKHGLKDLEITNVKDYGMTELYDDRAIQIIKNKGQRADGGILQWRGINMSELDEVIKEITNANINNAKLAEKLDKKINKVFIKEDRVDYMLKLYSSLGSNVSKKLKVLGKTIDG